MRNVPQQDTLCSYERLQPFCHVIEIVGEPLKLIGVCLHELSGGNLNPRRKVPFGKFAGSLSHAHQGSAEEEHQSECRQSSHGNRYWKLWESIAHETWMVFLPHRGRLKPDILIAVTITCDDRHEPYIMPVNFAAIDSVGEMGRECWEGGRPNRAAEHLSIPS